MRYSPAGDPGAVDADLFTVNAWPRSACVTISWASPSTLRAVAVAIHAGNHGRALAHIGASPLDRLSTEALTPALLRDPIVSNSMTRTFSLAAAQDLRDALTDAITELTEAPQDYRTDPADFPEGDLR